MLVLAIVAGHVVALVALALWSGPALIAALLALAVGLSMIRAMRRPWPIRLRLLRGGIWEIRSSDGRIERGSLCCGRIMGALVCLTLGGRPQRTVLLMPDAFRDGDHSRLRAWLRHRRGDAPC